MDKTAIGYTIARHRKEKGFTQKQLADILAVSNKTISKWETGEGFPDITILPALAETLSMTVDELLGGNKLNNIETPENTAVECAEYLAGKTIVQFKNSCIFSCAFSIFGVMTYWVLWHELQNMLSLLVSFAFGLTSGCIGLIGYNTLQAQINKFNGLFPDKKKNLSDIKRYLEKAIYSWMLFAWVAVDFTIVNRYGNQYELIRLFMEGLVYGFVCLCLNSKFKKRIKL